MIAGGGVIPGKTAGGHEDEFPTIREQDLALILADWVRLKTQANRIAVGTEPDAIDLTIIVAELSKGLHARSLGAILNYLPATPVWEHLRARLQHQLQLKKATEELTGYDQRILPVH